jgi:hypothetical protein
MWFRGAALALLALCGCPATHPEHQAAPGSSALRVRRVNAALDIPVSQRIPSDIQLKDGSTPARTYVGGTRHWDDPIVHTWDNVLSPEECKEIIDLAKPGLKRANVSDDSRGHTSDSRTNDNSWLVHDRSPLTWMLVERIAAIVGVPPTHAESIQVIHYGEQRAPLLPPTAAHTSFGVDTQKSASSTRTITTRTSTARSTAIER